MATYTDDQLSSAVAAARSWRGVLRGLGLPEASAGAIRAARRHADRLGLDRSHFTGQRRWTDHELKEAVARSGSWTEVQGSLGLSPHASSTALRGHALRLGLDTGHLGTRPPQPPGEVPGPRPSHLPRAGALLAATWFTLSSLEVAWPLEPCRYDLLVRRDTDTHRVQVKTTRVRSRNSWTVRLEATSSGAGPYDPDDIDQFFVIDGDLGLYLLPIAAVGGYRSIELNAYQAFRLPPLALPA